MGSWYRLFKSSGKCDRKEEPRRGTKSRPRLQLWSDENVPAVGAKGQDTEQARQAGSMARPHRNPRPFWLVPPVLSELPINTAGDRGNRASKQPFGQESKPTAWLRHCFLWAVPLPLVAGQFCFLCLFSWESRAHKSPQAELCPPPNCGADPPTHVRPGPAPQAVKTCYGNCHSKHLLRLWAFPSSRNQRVNTWGGMAGL